MVVRSYQPDAMSSRPLSVDLLLCRLCLLLPASLFHSPECSSLGSWVGPCCAKPRAAGPAGRLTGNGCGLLVSNDKMLAGAHVGQCPGQGCLRLSPGLLAGGEGERQSHDVSSLERTQQLELLAQGTGSFLGIRVPVQPTLWWLLPHLAGSRNTLSPSSFPSMRILPWDWGSSGRKAAGGVT